jgi:hypothetical protein
MNATHPSRRKSNASDEVRQRNFQGGRDSHKAVNRDIFLSTFHSTYVRRIEVRLFGKFFLAHASLLAINADIFAQNAPMFWEGTHTYNRNRKRGQRLTDIPAILSCHFARTAIQHCPIGSMKNRI